MWWSLHNSDHMKYNWIVVGRLQVCPFNLNKVAFIKRNQKMKNYAYIIFSLHCGQNSKRVLDKTNRHRPKNRVKNKQIFSTTKQLKASKNVKIHFSIEDKHMVNKHMKKCSELLVIRKMQIKTTVEYHFTTRMTIIKKKTATKTK